jgi:phage terminase small subunit
MITKLQQRFIDEYLSDPKRVASYAAERAGYSPKSAKFAGCRVLRKPEIQRAIDEREAAIRRKLDAAAEKAYVDEAMVVSGILKSIEDARAAGVGAWQMQAIQRGYELLGRHLGMFKDQVEIGLDEQIIAQLEQGRERARGIRNEEDQNEEEKPAEETPKPN